MPSLPIPGRIALPPPPPLRALVWWVGETRNSATSKKRTLKCLDQAATVAPAEASSGCGERPVEWEKGVAVVVFIY